MDAQKFLDEHRCPACGGAGKILQSGEGFRQYLYVVCLKESPPRYRVLSDVAPEVAESSFRDFYKKVSEMEPHQWT